MLNCRSIPLLLPLHGEVAQGAYDAAWEVLAYRDKYAEPPVGNHHATTLEHRL